MNVETLASQSYLLSQLLISIGYLTLATLLVWLVNRIQSNRLFTLFVAGITYGAVVALSAWIFSFDAEELAAFGPLPHYLQLISNFVIGLGILGLGAAVTWAINRYKGRTWWSPLTSSLSLGVATAFFLWVISSSPTEMRQLEALPLRYGFFLLPGIAIAGLAALIMRLNGWQHELAAMSYASCVVYFSFLKVLGWNLTPWVIVTLTIPLFWCIRKSATKVGSSTLLLQSMGTLSGLYMSLHLHDFLSGWIPFQEVVAGMWLLITGTGG